MLKSASLAIATVLGATALVPQKDANLPKRVQELEQWKATADARLQALEGQLKTEGKPAASAPADSAERVLTVTITNKRFDPSNARARKYEDNIWRDVEYTATGLQRPARSIKGVLEFCDLFGDPRFQVRVTIDDPIKPEGKLQRMPHETVGIRKADDGRRSQAMTCKVCATTTTVYEDPDGFQVNFDWPDGRKD